MAVVDARIVADATVSDGPKGIRLGVPDLSFFFLRQSTQLRQALQSALRISIVDDDAVCHSSMNVFSLMKRLFHPGQSTGID